MAIHKMLDCSTAHITRHDNELFTEHARVAEFNSSVHDFLPVRMSPHEHGYIVFVSDKEGHADRLRAISDAGLSDAFVGLYDFAVKHDCFLINLDSDGDVIEGLPTHDW
mgnify:FL=1